MSMSILLFVSLLSNKIVSEKKVPLYSTYLLSILILILKKKKEKQCLKKKKIKVGMPLVKFFKIPFQNYHFVDSSLLFWCRPINN